MSSKDDNILLFKGNLCNELIQFKSLEFNEQSDKQKKINEKKNFHDE